MSSPQEIKLEAKYQKCVKQFPGTIPDGIVAIDLDFLHMMNISSINSQEQSNLFHVIEGDEKLTLYNDEFVIWIVPFSHGAQPITYILIAFNEEEKETVEMMLSASGVYNSSKIILRVIERCIEEIKENESCIHQLNNDLGGKAS